MATIYTNTANFTTAAPSKLWQDPTAWVGNVVPTSADTVYIRGIRTTLNQASIASWAGTLDITVASTTGFPATGSFFTVTDRGMKVKVDYTGSSATQFRACSIDSDYFPFVSSSFPDRFGGSIFNGAYVHFSPTILVTGSFSASCLLGIVEYGANLKVTDGGTFYVGNYLTVRDGTLHASGSATFRYNYHNASQTAGEISRIIGENYYLSHIIMEADDTRSNTNLTSTAIAGSTFLSCSSANTLFADGDRIAVSNRSNRIVMDYDALDINYSSKLLYDNEEGLLVTGATSNAVYVGLVNGLKCKVLDIQGDPATTIIVDETRFKVGDKINSGTGTYTITAIEDYDHLLADYDFSSGATLANWETDTVRSSYFSNFTVSSSYALIQHATTSYRHLFIKDIMRSDVKIEAWISNYRGITSGVSDGGALGIAFHSAPVLDFDYGNSSGGRSYFGWDVDNNRYYLYSYAMSNYSNNRLTSGSIPTYGHKKLTVDCRKGFVKGYIDDQLVIENILRLPPSVGRVGVFCDAQNSFSCTRYKVYAPSQKLTLDNPFSGAVGDYVYESGTEFTHTTADTIIKLSSTVTDALGHKNLAYCYRGMDKFQNDSVYPYIYATNTTTRTANTSHWCVLSNNNHTSYNYDVGTGTDKYQIIDLTQQTNFTHISYKEYYYAYGQTLNGISVSGSNDMVNWTGLFNSASLTDRRTSQDALRLLDLGGTKSFRYVRVGRTLGTSYNANNLNISLGVHDFSGGYKITVNNASDLNIGDKIHITHNNGYNPDQGETYMTYVAAGTEPFSRFITKMRNDYIITDKSGTTLTLDRPFILGHLEGGEQVIKLNRNIVVSGSRETAMWSLGRLWLYVGSNYGRRYEFKNVEFSNMSSYYPTNWRDYTYCNLAIRSYNYYDNLLFDGITLYNQFASDTSYGWSNYNASNLFFKNSFVSTIGGRGWGAYYPSPYDSAHVQTNNIFADVYFTYAYGYSEYHSGYYNISYNQIIACAGIGGYAVNDYSWYRYGLSRYQVKKKITKRNYSNGIPGANLTHYQAIRSDSVQNWTEIENNTGDAVYSYYIYGVGNLSRYIDGNKTLIKKEMRLEDRLTNWTNIGLMYNEYTDIGTIMPWIKNYNRSNYTVGYLYPYWVVKFDGENFWRYYNFGADYRSPMLMLAIFSNVTTPIYVTFGFDYISDMSHYTCDEGTYQQRLVVQKKKNNYRLETDDYLAKSTSWQSYTKRITIDSPGSYEFIVGSTFRHGYVGIKNMFSTISTTATNNDDYMIIKNTLNVSVFTNPFTTSLRDITQKTDSKLRLNGGRL